MEDSNTYSFIGKNIQWMRKRSFVTQEQLAFESNVSQSRVSLIETGRAIPTCEEIIGIANFFGVSFDALLREDGRMKEAGSKWYELKEENNKLRAENSELKRKLYKRGRS